MNLAGFAVTDTIMLPARTDFGIGIIGCGGIVNYAHLPAYRKAGFRVLACYDRNPEAAERTARDHRIPRVASSIDDLLGDPEIAIVIELIGGYEPAKSFVLKAIANGKHIVTANKALLAVHGEEIYAAAARNGVEVLYTVEVLASSERSDLEFSIAMREPPTNPSFSCPVLLDCDVPLFTKYCVRSVPCFVNASTPKPCPVAEAVESSNWGKVKALYRD